MRINAEMENNRRKMIRSRRNNAVERITFARKQLSKQAALTPAHLEDHFTVLLIYRTEWSWAADSWIRAPLRGFELDLGNQKTEEITRDKWETNVKQIAMVDTAKSHRAPVSVDDRNIELYSFFKSSTVRRWSPWPEDDDSLSQPRRPYVNTCWHCSRHTTTVWQCREPRSYLGNCSHVALHDSPEWRDRINKRRMRLSRSIQTSLDLPAHVPIKFCGGGSGGGGVMKFAPPRVLTVDTVPANNKDATESEKIWLNIHFNNV